MNTSIGSKRTLVPAAHADFRVGAREIRPTARLHAANPAFARRNPPPRRGCGDRRARSKCMPPPRARWPAVRARRRRRDNPTPEQQQAAIRAALDLAANDRPPRDQLVQVATAAVEEARAFVRAHDLITLPDWPGARDLDAGIQSRRCGRVLRFTGPARSQSGDLLRRLADSRTIGPMRRPFRSCANTIRAASPMSACTKPCLAITCRSGTPTNIPQCCARCWGRAPSSKAGPSTPRA